jgi:hypothetical protein
VTANAASRSITRDAIRSKPWVRFGPQFSFRVTSFELIGLGLGLAVIFALMPSSAWPVKPGIDWHWYASGIANLVGGRPLYDTRLLAGPYDFWTPENAYAYNMAPWVVPLIAPFAALGDLSRWAWLVAMDLAIAVALLLVLPTRRRLLILALFLVSTPILMLFVWGNIGALVVLGVALWLVGRERGSERLMAVGLVLASVKVLPAVPLVLLMLRERRWRPVIAAAVVTGGVTLALTVATGRSVLADFALTILNIKPVEGANLAPSFYVGHMTEIRAASIAAVGLLALRRPSLLTLAFMELAICGLVTNLYGDWLVAPAMILVFAIREIPEWNSRQASSSAAREVRGGQSASLVSSPTDR